MKNEDVVEALKRAEAAAIDELVMLIEMMKDADFDEYDIQAIEDAKKDVATALSRIADQFPIKPVVQKM